MIRPVPRNRQAGIAALTAILVVAIATVLAVNLLWETSIDLHRTETLLLQDQARQFALGGEELAKIVLAQDKRDDGPNGRDTMREVWAQPRSFPYASGTMDLIGTDQQGRFDLNSMVTWDGKRDADAAEQYQRLLMLLDVDSSTAEALTDATVDWLDAGSETEINGAEDGDYTALQPPYRAANFWFTSTSELLAVKGYTPEIYARLAPNITALPPPREGRRAINVNTATAAVLASLDKEQTLDSVEPFVNQDYESISQFLEGTPIKAKPERISVNSDWFLLTATISIGTSQSTMYSLLERTGDVVLTRLRTFDAL